MASRVVMPKLTDTMEEGVVVKWKKHEGDPVAAGDVLAEIETDKAVMDLEAFATGTLRKTLADEGDTVKAGALIAVIGEADEDIQPVLSETTRAAQPAAAPPQERTQDGKPPEIGARATPRPAGAKDQPPPSTPARSSERVIASPRAKALAAELGVDLSTIHGTGPEGRIIEQDVRQAMPASRHVSRTTDRPLSQMRKAIIRATTQSKAPVPHFYLTTDIDMEEAEKLRASFKHHRVHHPSVTDVLIKASALALEKYPSINVSYTGDAIRHHATIDIGIAVGLDDGLITPVLRDCGAKSLEQIAEESRPLIERARQKQLQPADYTGATFSISNLGMYDVDNFIAVLLPPEAAAVAVGAIRDVPVVERGTVRTGRRMTVTLSCDHRVLDGVQAAQFLQEFKRLLEHPLELLLPKETA